MISTLRNRYDKILLIIIVLLSFIHISVSANCKLQADQATRNRFNDVISNEKKYIYLNLNFTDKQFNNTEFAYLTSTVDVIDPLAWVLAIGGRGNLLPGCPFDFRYVSLGTLSTSGVTTVDINIIDTSDCFMGSNTSDKDKLDAIVDLITGLVIENIDVSNDNTIDLKTVQICLEKQSNETRYIYRQTQDLQILIQRLSTSSHEVLQSTAVYECWYPVENVTQPIIVPRDIATPVFNSLINTIVVIIILFSPHLFFQLLDWKNPPKDGKIRIDTQPYPFGFSHCVFYSTYCGTPCTSDLCSFWCWVRYLFFIGFMCCLCCIQFIPLAYVDRDNYKLRQMAAERLEVWKFDWTNNLLTIWAVIVIVLNTFAFNILKLCIMGSKPEVDKAPKKDQQDQESFDEIGRSFLTRILFPLNDKVNSKDKDDDLKDKDHYIRKIICPDGCGNAFKDSPIVWDLLSVLQKIWSGKIRTWMTKLLLSGIVLIYWIGHMIPLIYYTTIVFAILASLCEYYCREQRGKGEVTQQTLGQVVLLLIMLTFWFGFAFVFVTIPVFFEMFVAFTHLTEIFGYTMIGIIVNAKYVVSWLVFGIGVASFLVQSATSYSNMYAQLFYDIFKETESLERHCGSEKSSALSQVSQESLNMLNAKLDYHPVSQDTDGVSKIELAFFEDVAYKMRPWGKALSVVWIKLVCVFVFFMVGVSILMYVDGLGDLNGQSDLVGAIVLGGIPSLLALLTSSSAFVLCQKKAKKLKLKKLIQSTASEFADKQSLNNKKLGEEERHNNPDELEGQYLQQPSLSVQHSDVDGDQADARQFPHDEASPESQNSQFGGVNIGEDIQLVSHHVYANLAGP